MIWQVKEEGWWLLLGDAETHELYAIKRMSVGLSATARLNFPVLAGNLEELREATLMLISDSYLGLDQQHTIEVCRRRGSKPSRKHPASTR